MALAFPVIRTQLGIMLMGTVDVMMLGRLSKEGLAAGALGNAVGFGLLVFPMGLLLGLDPLIAQAYGAGEHERIAGHLWRGAILAVAMSIPVSIVMFDAEWLLGVAGAGGAAAVGGGGLHARADPGQCRVPAVRRGAPGAPGHEHRAAGVLRHRARQPRQRGGELGLRSSAISACRRSASRARPTRPRWRAG